MRSPCGHRPSDDWVVQAPDAVAWARLQLGYMRAARVLDQAHRGCIHPQRRPALRTAMVATLGRLLEVRRILLAVPGAEVAMTAAAKEMRMTPLDCELPLPGCFREERSQVITFKLSLVAGEYPMAGSEKYRSFTWDNNM